MLLSDHHQLVRDTFRSFAQERLLPGAAERDRTARFPSEILKELGALGAMGVLVPEEYGGGGMDYLALAVMLEVMGLCRPS
jgi:hypothetical protein